MPDLLLDNDFSVASPVSDLRFSAPLNQYGIPDLLISEQDFCIERSSFIPLAIDTPHPTLAGFFLASESPMQPTAVANIMKWTRKHCKVPASFSRPGGTYNYAFPAILSSSWAQSRQQPKTLTVASRIQTDFFHTSTPDSIPIIEAQRYIIAGRPGIDALGPQGQPCVSDASFTTAVTDPSAATYLSWVAGGVEIVPEMSKVTPFWNGFIHMRETIYVKAK